MTAKNTAASRRLAKPRNRIVRALLSRIISAGGGPHRHALQKRERPRDDRDLDQCVRECGEW
ncbi:hypothetical protein SAMN05216350_11623 [Polaromonas sp. YR568]|uniref:hypothetical protein n=1 Tax=Polaromonas sp. YR568 TaxID=1855301 RepID=UPI0008DF2146|nr:hypothetical protein [Polaromonas sp. YR568]SFV03262.1 hypothetical protein SAMN05216350_11623 [Polaromonas sp. YR568]